MILTLLLKRKDDPIVVSRLRRTLREGDSWIVVPLSTDTGDPEVVDHIGRREMDLDRTTHREMHLVRSPYPELGIAELPPPLMTDRLDHESIRSEEHTSELQSRDHLVCRL